MFEHATSSLGEYSNTVTAYIGFCEDRSVSPERRINYNNDKPWFNPKLRQVHQSKEEAYRSEDWLLYNQARNTINREIKAAKKSYSRKLSSMLSINEPSAV